MQKRHAYNTLNGMYARLQSGLLLGRLLRRRSSASRRLGKLLHKRIVGFQYGVLRFDRYSPGAGLRATPLCLPAAFQEAINGESGIERTAAGMVVSSS